MTKRQGPWFNRGPGWKVTPLDEAEDVTEQELHALYIGSQDPFYDELHAHLVVDLPPNGSVTYGLGPHSIPIIEAVLETTRPKRILEIGFGVGFSSSIFLDRAPRAHVVSVDLLTDPRAQQAAERIAERFKPRFKALGFDSQDPELESWIRQSVMPGGRGPLFDLIFVDGGHDLETVRSDIALGIRLGIPWFLFDDWWPFLGPGVQSAFRERQELQVAAQWGNLVLAHVSDR